MRVSEFGQLVDEGLAQGCRFIEALAVQAEELGEGLLDHGFEIAVLIAVFQEVEFKEVGFAMGKEAANILHEEGAVAVYFDGGGIGGGFVVDVAQRGVQEGESVGLAGDGLAVVALAGGHGCEQGGEGEDGGAGEVVHGAGGCYVFGRHLSSGKWGRSISRLSWQGFACRLLPVLPFVMSRISIPEYVMALAHVAALRSEDPYRKVGAAALDKDNRVIGTAYNGLFPGFDPQEEFWQSRDERQKFMLHAEINLCSLFKRGEARVVACTTMPCTSCMQALCAHGVKTIYYGEAYASSEAPAIAEMYDVQLIQVPSYPLAEQFPLVREGSRLDCGCPEH